MKFSCCTGLENLEWLEAAGYDRIILPCTELVKWTDGEFKKAAEKLQKSTLECRALNSFCTADLRLCGPDYMPERVSEYIGILAPRAKKLGVRYIGVGAPKSRSIPEGYNEALAMDQWLQTLRILCDACKSCGITVLLEAVCALEGNWMTTTKAALAVLHRANLPNLQLVFDTYHAFMMGEDEKPLHEAIKYVPLVHMAQNFSGKRHYLRWEHFDEYKVYIDELLSAGFDGEIAVEAFYDDMREQLSDTLEIMKALCVRRR